MHSPQETPSNKVPPLDPMPTQDPIPHQKPPGGHASFTRFARCFDVWPDGVRPSPSRPLPAGRVTGFPF
jgi:hypothetical protein